MASMGIPQKRQFCVQNWYLHRALPASLLEKQQVAPPLAITTVESNASSKRRYAKDDRKSHLHSGAAQTDTCLNRIIDWIGPLECMSRAKQQRKSKHEMGRWLAVIVAKKFECALVLRNSFFMARQFEWPLQVEWPCIYIIYIYIHKSFQAVHTVPDVKLFVVHSLTWGKVGPCIY